MKDKLGRELLILCGLFLVLAGTTPAVEPGQTRDQVTAELGTAANFFRMGDREVLYYDRGRVELVGRLVTAVEWRSARDLEQLEAQREALLRQRREAAEAHAKRQWEPPPLEAPPIFDETEHASIASAVPDVANFHLQVEQIRVDALKAELEAVEAQRRSAVVETQLLRRQLTDEVMSNAPVPPPAPIIVNQVIQETVVITDSGRPRQRRVKPEAERSDKPLERYSISRRLGPMDGNPEFGGRP